MTTVTTRHERKKERKKEDKETDAMLSFATSRDLNRFVDTCSSQRQRSTSSH